MTSLPCSMLPVIIYMSLPVTFASFAHFDSRPCALQNAMTAAFRDKVLGSPTGRVLQGANVLVIGFGAIGAPSRLYLPIFGFKMDIFYVYYRVRTARALSAADIRYSIDCLLKIMSEKDALTHLFFLSSTSLRSAGDCPSIARVRVLRLGREAESVGVRGPVRRPGDESARGARLVAYRTPA
jgi:hypothetical protein